MSSSQVASLLIFIVIGIYTLGFRTLAFAESDVVTVAVGGAMVLNAIFYHYVSMYLEVHPTLRNSLNQAPVTEWWIRTFNNCLLLSLWFLAQFSWNLFLAFLLIQYFSYLLWDVIVRRHISIGIFLFLDIGGLMITVAFVFCGYRYQHLIATKGPIDPATIEMSQAFLVAAMFYVVIVGVGVAVLKFNPFKASYWVRPQLR